MEFDFNYEGLNLHINVRNIEYQKPSLDYFEHFDYEYDIETQEGTKLDIKLDSRTRHSIEDAIWNEFQNTQARRSYEYLT